MNLENDTQRKCTLAEELGHYKRTVGNILDQTQIENRKQERKARAWGYEKVIPIHRLIEGYLTGVQNRYELAEFLGVTEQYLIEVVDYYYQKHGVFVHYDDYIVYFNPLAIFNKYEEMI